MKIEGIHAISALDGLNQPPPAVFRVTAQTAKMADFIFQNMAYRATVYRIISVRLWNFKDGGS